jgi:hypothetical protein
MSMSLEDVWREEAYDQMVEEFLETHRDEIIGEFVSERMASYYSDNPDLAVAAEGALEEARNLLDINPAASLVFSRSATEIALRDVLLRPVVHGMLHDDFTSSLIADLVLRSPGFEKLLFTVLEEHGVDLKKGSRKSSKKCLWEEIVEVRKARNCLLHKGVRQSPHLAEVSLDIAGIIIEELHPYLREKITGN